MTENKPFTFEEAEEICEDFEDLTDTEFTLTVSGNPTVFIVDAIIISPFDIAEKEQFIADYYQSKDAAAALGSYDGPDYDVLLMVSEAADEVNYSYLGIRTFIQEKGIQYNFPS